MDSCRLCQRYVPSHPISIAFPKIDDGQVKAKKDLGPKFAGTGRGKEGEL